MTISLRGKTLRKDFERCKPAIVNFDKKLKISRYWQNSQKQQNIPAKQ